ncbi:MAG: T9SS type A sorting domain-containing protein [Ignavibacteria bacterium]|nr:T9SS type A sorting domain-containing protein [Ignavibacteria bacterium]
MRVIIILIFILVVLLTFMSKAQTYSSITYDAGTSVEVQTNADVCADDIFINGTYSGGGTICTGALPVTLISLESRVSKRDVKLIWVTENEINNRGFDIERRKADNGSWEKISFVKGMGNTTGQTIYSYDDKKLNTGKYKYRLKQIDYNQNFEYYDLANDVDIGKPLNFDVSQNYPNPSNPRSKIDYEIPVSGKVAIKIYNLLGQEVVSIMNEVKEAGYYTAEFDGTNLASGVYIYRLIAEGEGEKFVKTMKMVLVK